MRPKATRPKVLRADLAQPYRSGYIFVYKRRAYCISLPPMMDTNSVKMSIWMVTCRRMAP